MLKCFFLFLFFFQTFDLKGSMRSRYVQTSGMKNDVLLDENLLESEYCNVRSCIRLPHSLCC